MHAETIAAAAVTEAEIRGRAFALTAGGLTPGLLFILFPSLEVSVGAVLRLAPEPRGGLRLVVGANFFPLGVQLSADYWPDDDSVELSALATFSL